MNTDNIGEIRKNIYWILFLTRAMDFPALVTCFDPEPDKKK